MSHPFSDSFVQRFWSHVEKRGDDECWPWTGKDRKEEGYGRVFLSRNRTPSSHRVAYQIANNVTIDPSVVVRHECDNPPCCNPKHLINGTILDNVADRQARGRQAKGSSSGRAKVSDEIVAAIRSEYVPYRVTLDSLAAKYGICRRQVWMIAHKRSWSHV